MNLSYQHKIDGVLKPLKPSRFGSNIAHVTEKTVDQVPFMYQFFDEMVGYKQSSFF